MNLPRAYAASPVTALLVAPAKPGEAVGFALANARLGPDAAIRIGERLAVDLPKTTPDGRTPLPLRASPHTAIILARGPADAGLAAIQAILARAGTSIDRSASALVVGTEHVVKAGEGSVLVTMLTTRLDGLTRAGYLDRWLTGHAPFGLRIDAAGYRQLHADGAADDRPGLPTANAYDGIGMVMFRDLAHVAGARAAPEVARDATADEMRFIDHSRSMLMMFRLLD